jgi:hypothetical protein
VRARARRLAVVASALLIAVAAACADRQAQRPEIRLTTDDFIFRISSEPMPPYARESHRWRVIVLDRETRRPIENGEGRIFANSRDGTSTWDGFAKGEEVGTYYGRLNFLTAGEWAMAVQFRTDSALPLQRVDWIQGVLPERPVGADSTEAARP